MTGLSSTGKLSHVPTGTHPKGVSRWDVGQLGQILVYLLGFGRILCPTGRILCPTIEVSQCSV